MLCERSKHLVQVLEYVYELRVRLGEVVERRVEVDLLALFGLLDGQTSVEVLDDAPECRLLVHPDWLGRH